MKFKANEDPLVYPEEFKCGMKEELEHLDVTGGDKETTKKIVLAHLREDPKYYSKLGTVMKKTASQIINSFLAEEEKSIIDFKKPDGTKLPNPSLKDIEAGLQIHEKKAEEEDSAQDYIKSLSKRSMPEGWKAPKGKPPQSEADLPSERLSAEEEYKKELGAPSMKQAVKPPTDVLGKPFSGTPKVGPTTPLKQRAEEEKGGVLDKIKSTLTDLTSSPKPEQYKTPTPLTKSSIRSMHQRAEEEDGGESDKMNELYSFVQWILDRDNTPNKASYAQLKAQYDVEKFAEKSEEEKVQESEMEKPARFQAEPEN
jgi:hypothetical protein